MVILRILGGIFIVFGLVACLTIIGIPIGAGAIIIGLLFILVGKKSRPIVVQVSHDTAPKV